MGLVIQKETRMAASYSLQRRYLKALETLVYLANKDHRQYWVLKAIYIADKEHLKRYGRQIFGDRYIAMKFGPVPSLAYNIVKSRRKDSPDFGYADADKALALVDDNKTVKPLRAANEDYISASEKECLDYAYEAIKGLSFDQLKEFTHDAAYEAAIQNDDMTIQNIIGTLDNSKDVLDYVCK